MEQLRLTLANRWCILIFLLAEWDKGERYKNDKIQENQPIISSKVMEKNPTQVQWQNKGKNMKRCSEDLRKRETPNFVSSRFPHIWLVLEKEMPVCLFWQQKHHIKQCIIVHYYSNVTLHSLNEILMGAELSHLRQYILVWL